jgi:hypothetical protein
MTKATHIITQVMGRAESCASPRRTSRAEINNYRLFLSPPVFLPQSIGLVAPPKDFQSKDFCIKRRLRQRCRRSESPSGTGSVASRTKLPQ